MKYTSILLRVELCAITALLLCSILMSIIAYIDNYTATVAGKSHVFTPNMAAWVNFSYTAMIGFFPAILFGAPMYTFINKNKKLLLSKTILIGLSPGVVLLIFSKNDLAIAALLCGLVISILTHYIYSFYKSCSNKSSNKSFKPTPKSGAV